MADACLARRRPTSWQPLSNQVARGHPRLDLVLPLRRLGLDRHQLLVADEPLRVLDLGYRRRGGQRRVATGGFGKGNQLTQEFAGTNGFLAALAGKPEGLKELSQNKTDLLR